MNLEKKSSQNKDRKGNRDTKKQKLLRKREKEHFKKTGKFNANEILKLANNINEKLHTRYHRAQEIYFKRLKLGKQNCEVGALGKRNEVERWGKGKIWGRNVGL